MSQYFLKPMSLLGETLMSKLIYLIIRQTDLKNISHIDVRN